MKIIVLLLAMLLMSCSKDSVVLAEDNTKTILVQPLKDLKQKDLEFVINNLKKICPNVEVLSPIDFPKNSFYPPRKRYRADSIIKFLNINTDKNVVKLALTSKDISVTKGENPDFGVMGLGYRPGRACIASNFRLNKNKKDQFFKVAIHELGHTEGLLHCQVKNCFMRDAEGGNPTDQLTEFCDKCRKILITKNWKLL